MSDRNKLTKKFQEFSFGDGLPAAAQAPAPAETPAGPRRLTEDDMKFVPYGKAKGGGFGGIFNGGGGSSGNPLGAMDDSHDGGFDAVADEEHEWNEGQERLFEAAGQLFRRNEAVQGVLDIISDLTMVNVLTAGMLDKLYRGVLADDRVDRLMMASLVVNVMNYDSIRRELPMETMRVADELHDLYAEEDASRRIKAAAALGPSSRRVFLANAISAMEKNLVEMREFGEPGPAKPDHDDSAALLTAASPGVEGFVTKRAAFFFNRLSALTGNDTMIAPAEDGALKIASAQDKALFGKDAAGPKSRPGGGTAPGL